ncbi:hypothetical protein V6R21_20730 [Limibacter armeniacum]|uniref:hypothetical protein n=1 Tax=Limibacter armeniacum TaxID=466084 RepID=UPI002FE64223
MNLWKHHLAFLKKQVNDFALTGNLPLLEENMLVVGHAQTDIYIGELSVGDIVGEVRTYLKDKCQLEEEAYKDWLYGEGHDYRMVQLSDDSVWTLRLGAEQGLFIHLHPARDVPSSVRVKAITLKTAILTLVMALKEDKDPYDVDLINSVRRTFLQAPPVQKLREGRGLEKILSILVK